MQISLEEFSIAIAAIHAAAACPERWPEALSAVARLVNSSEAKRGRVKVLAFDALGDDPQVYQGCEPSVRRVMALLAPHFRTAKQVQMRLAEALPGRLALASLDRLAVAAFILSGGGAVYHLNASARTLLADDGCIRVANSRFRLREPAALNTAFEAALRRATQNPPRSSLLPLPSGDKEVYEVTVSPLPGDEAALSACPVRLALVTIARPRPDAKRIVQRVRPLYGLTEAEARVMAALTLGATVDEITQAHGVRTSTVRAQVRSIFEKTGVHRQSDLVRLALTGAPLLSEPEH